MAETAASARPAGQSPTAEPKEQRNRAGQRIAQPGGDRRSAAAERRRRLVAPALQPDADRRFDDRRREREHVQRGCEVPAQLDRRHRGAERRGAEMQGQQRACAAQTGIAVAPSSTPV